MRFRNVAYYAVLFFLVVAHNSHADLTRRVSESCKIAHARVEISIDNEEAWDADKENARTVAVKAFLAADQHCRYTEIEIYDYFKKMGIAAGTAMGFKQGWEIGMNSGSDVVDVKPTDDQIARARKTAAIPVDENVSCDSAEHSRKWLVENVAAWIVEPSAMSSKYEKLASSVKKSCSLERSRWIVISGEGPLWEGIGSTVLSAKAAGYRAAIKSRKGG